MDSRGSEPAKQRVAELEEELRGLADKLSRCQVPERGARSGPEPGGRVPFGTAGSRPAPGGRGRGALPRVPGASETLIKSGFGPCPG